MQLNFEVCHILCSFLDPNMTMQLVSSCRLLRHVARTTLPRLRIALKVLVDEYGDRHEMFGAKLLSEFEFFQLNLANYLCDIIKDLAEMLLSGCKVRKVRQLRPIENYNLFYTPYYFSVLVGILWIRVNQKSVLQLGQP